MKSFDFYEFAGIIAPGSIVLLAVHIAAPDLLASSVGELSLGGLGVFTIVAYVAGHLVQSIGNAVEFIWWFLWRGMPTDWIRTGRGDLLAAAQLSRLAEQMELQLGLRPAPAPSSLSKKAWFGVTRQMYAAVAGAGRAGRVETFNGNYGLNRGIASALLLVATAVAVNGSDNWPLAAALLVIAGAALVRMHRFGKHYARELFVQFLQLPRP